MTDEKIIKAMKFCSDTNCLYCPLLDAPLQEKECKSNLILNALDLINRQKAEIESLQNDLRIWKNIAHRETSYVENARAEAIKEFAERLKEKRYLRPMSQAEYFGLCEEKWVVNVDVIDNLVKEMVGDTE